MKHLSKALAAAQSEFAPVIKDASNPFFKSSYATLASYLHATQGALAKHGLSVAQPLVWQDGQLCVRTLLMHESGESVDSVCPVLATKPDPQSLGSAISYMRRYAYAAMLCVAQVDDDGEHAMSRDTVPVNLPPKSTAIGYQGSDTEKKMLFEWIKAQKLPADVEIRDIASQLHLALIERKKKISEAGPILKDILERL